MLDSTKSLQRRPMSDGHALQSETYPKDGKDIDILQSPQVLNDPYVLRDVWRARARSNNNGREMEKVGPQSLDIDFVVFNDDYGRARDCLTA